MPVIAPTEPLCKSVRFDLDSMWLELVDGRSLGVPLSYFPRLLRATPAQRRKFVISGGGIGIHWDKLDEDISVAGLVLGRGDREAGQNGDPYRIGPRTKRRRLRSPDLQFRGGTPKVASRLRKS